MIVRRLSIGLSIALALGWAGVSLASSGAGPGPAVHRAAGTVNPGTSPGERIQGVIARVAAAQKALHTLRAHFRETKTGALFLHPVVSTGTFSFRAPDSARWDYERPRRMVVVFTHDVLTTFDATTGHVQRLRVGLRQRRLVKFLTGTQPLDRLIENFRVTLFDAAPDKPFVVQLEPEGPAMRRKLRRIRIDIDKTLYLPVRLELVDGSGDTTVYELSDIEVNPKLAPGLFTAPRHKNNAAAARESSSSRRR
ncbi:MAG: outer membrane lipoprotein carrier protein LolA [Acidobacteria bacterium]|nr:outer membrane lipoprotein carrier protein LolA [Acidobacteriota bacterium]